MIYEYLKYSDTLLTKLLNIPNIKYQKCCKKKEDVGAMSLNNNSGIWYIQNQNTEYYIIKWADN